MHIHHFNCDIFLIKFCWSDNLFWKRAQNNGHSWWLYTMSLKIRIFVASASFTCPTVMSPWKHRLVFFLLLGTGFQGSIASFGAISTNACRCQQLTRWDSNVLWLVFYGTSNCSCLRRWWLNEVIRKLAEIYLTNVDFSFILVYCWWTVRNQSQTMENSMPKQQHQNGTTSAQLFFIFLRWKAVISWIAYLRSTCFSSGTSKCTWPPMTHWVVIVPQAAPSRFEGWRMVKGPSDEMSAAGVKMQGQKISRETERYNVQ